MSLAAFVHGTQRARKSPLGGYPQIGRAEESYRLTF